MYNFTLPPPIQNQGALGGFAQGMTNALAPIGMMQGIQQGNIKNALLQEELAKREAVKKAMAGYGTEGFDLNKASTELMKIDPDQGVKMIQAVRGMNKDRIETMSAGIKLVEAMAPGLMNNPNMYPISSKNN